MKRITAVLISSLCMATIAKAESACYQNMQTFFNKNAPTTQTVVVNGVYAKSGMNLKGKPCEVAVNLYGHDLSPKDKSGLMWPFGWYPTVEPVSSEDRDIKSFSCKASDSEISMSLSYRNLSGWYETRTTGLSILKNNEGTVDLRIQDGGGGSEIVCRGTLSEK